MESMSLYFDSNGELNLHGVAYLVYKGKRVVRPMVRGKKIVDIDTDEYPGYNQYQLKLLALKEGLEEFEKYLIKENLTGIELNCFSQHSYVNNMVALREQKGKYQELMGEILEIIDALGEEYSVVVGIGTIKGDANPARQAASELLAEIRSKPKTVTVMNSANDIKKSLKKSEKTVENRVPIKGRNTTNADKDNIIKIDRFKIV